MEDHALLSSSRTQDVQPRVTVVIATRDDQLRLPRMLDMLRQHFDRQDYDTEIVIVDDASSDNSSAIVQRAIDDALMASQRRARCFITLMRTERIGKTRAICAGVLSAHGDYVVVSEAGLAVPIEQIDALLGCLARGAAIAIGSREGVGAQRLDEPFVHRSIDRIVSSTVRRRTGLTLRDTQCKLRAFSRDAAFRLFRHISMSRQTADRRICEGDAFEVEVLLLAQQYGFEIKEVPIRWRYMRLENNNPVRRSVRMLRDIQHIGRNNERGLYHPMQEHMLSDLGLPVPLPNEGRA